MAASETSCTSKAASLTAAVSAPAKQDRSRIKKSAAPAPPRSLVGASSAVGQQQRQPLQRSAHAGSVVSCPPGATGAGPRALSDDCAIDDLLEGRMDLRLVLPDGREVLVNVERRTPVMDLLVQVATAHKINPSGHFVQAPSERGDMLTCKPNTAIGSLDVSHLLIVPKGAPPVAGGAADLAFWQRKGMRPSSKPFEPTQRIQVRLPRNQLMVQRLPLTTTLGELRQSVCTEKGLDPQGYQLVRPSLPTRALDLGCTLHEYGASEVALLSNRTLAVNIQNSTADIMSYSLNQENKRGSHVFPQHSGSKGSLTGSSSDGASSRGTSPTRSELPVVFSRPATKKRPAPPPPLPASPPPTIPEQEPEESPTTLGTKGGRREGGGHSRQSSDSSGYHEASVLSDLPDTPSPEAVQGRPNCSMARQESPSQTSAATEVVMHRRSAPVECSSRPVRPQSTISEAGTISHGKKRKAPPPPPLALQLPSPAPKHAPVEGTKPAGVESSASPDTPEARLAEPSPPAADEKGEQRACVGDVGLLPPPSPFFSAPALPPGGGHSNKETPVPKPRLLTVPLWQPAPEDNEPKEFDEASAAYKRMVFSRIDATFDSIEDSDSLAVDNSACVSDSASWEYTIPEPPSPFRTRACGESESQAVSLDTVQLETKVEETEPEPIRSDVSRDDSGLPDDLGSKDDAAKVTTEPHSDSSTDQDKSKCEESSVHISVSTVAVTSVVELSVPQEETGQHQSSSAKEEKVRKPEDQSEACSDNQSLKMSSVSVAPIEKSPLSQPKHPDLDQESDEDAAVVAHEPIPRRDSLQIYRLKEVKVSSQHTESSASGEQEEEEQNAAEPALETDSQKESIVALSSAPEEEVVISVVVASQEPKKSLAKAAVEKATSEQPHISSSNSNSSKEKHQASEDSRDTSQAGVLDRRELVKMSSYPSASEARVEASKIVRGVSGKDSPQTEENDTIEQQEIKVTRRQQDVERTPRPISFSIGSYGSYKTEVVDVDNIYSGEALKPNYERFKNIKVVSPSNAKSSTQAAVASKVAVAPTRSDGKHSHNGETTITVKIGRRETSEPELEHSSKQSVSTVDLRPGQHTVPLLSSEAGQLQFEEEKDNLLSEYTKLQEQFVVWQQQLASNQNMLEDKKIVPSTVALSTSEPQQSQVRGDSAAVGVQHDARISTLPRAKPVRPLSLVEERSRAFKQQGSAECATSPVVVNFGTWKDKREERSVVSTTAAFSRQRSVGSGELTEEKTSKCNADPAKTAQSNGKQHPKPVPKKPTGILYAAPTVRGFSQEAIEKLSQEASLHHKPVQSQKQDASDGESRVQLSKYSQKGRVASSDQHAASELSASSQDNGADRRSLPPYLQSEVVRLAKQPSATLEQQQSTSSGSSGCSNNKPSIVQATLKPGVTVEPLVSARPVVKVNGHVGASQPSLDHGTVQSERGAAHVKRSTSECDGPRKFTATRSQDAAKNAQMSSIGTRDILMDEIRNFGGKGSLRKVSTEPAWQLNVCGLRSA